MADAKETNHECQQCGKAMDAMEAAFKKKLDAVARPQTVGEAEKLEALAREFAGLLEALCKRSGQVLSDVDPCDLLHSRECYDVRECQSCEYESPGKLMRVSKKNGICMCLGEECQPPSLSTDFQTCKQCETWVHVQMECKCRGGGAK
eukprot:CAMPEP_0167800400 /NCGR_PEP_ID=MMETSP0111_2-20121227/17699_1 /TAXON_ID=91324 /ORGANISM="Lotharella globosa, Strain CCCM811" /LENGTH=147 /DNA_ID=CAMNT_0007695633 /DNA_START=37 /DNA_END=480 /DNA_ORIENTATION=+